MAIKILEESPVINDDKFRRVVLLDEEADMSELNKVECAAGSMAIIADKHNLLILNTKGEWV